MTFQYRLHEKRIKKKKHAQDQEFESWPKDLEEKYGPYRPIKSDSLNSSQKKDKFSNSNKPDKEY
jgi:hypothetical protein